MFSRKRSSSGAMDPGPSPASLPRLTRPVADAQTTTPKHSSSHLQSPSDRPSLLRLPSSASSLATLSNRSRRVTNPAAARTPTSSATATPATPATTPSYFSPQQPSAAKEVRSPGTGRPPASFSSFGKAYGDTSRGPPISASGTWPKQHAPTRSLSIAPDHMASSREGSFTFESPVKLPRLPRPNGQGRSAESDAAAAEGDGEDLFLNIAEDSAKASTSNAVTRSDRLRSRIARGNRQSLPSSIPSLASAGATRPNGARIPAAIDTSSAATQYRRSSLLPTSATRTSREQSPLTPANPVFTPRLRGQEVSPRARRSATSLTLKDQEPQPQPARADAGSSYSPNEFQAQADSIKTRQQDSTLSPKDFLAQLEASRRRPSYPETLQTPPNNRNGPFKPSNLHFHSSSRDNVTIPHVDTPPEARSRYTETESHGSTGPATSMWDELDELKSRMKRLEMGGKIPATSGAAIAQASAERPPTANTSATTVSTSPRQQRKLAPSEYMSPVSTSKKTHPLLHDALAKVKGHTAPAIYRALDATAQEALALAEMAGSGGPQGALSSTNSILGGQNLADRQVRRKADHICRSLTELCIELYDNKPSFVSPALQRTSAAAVSRRPSLQINGDSPTIRQSVEPESDTLPRSSPSRAMSRIEARRSSMMTSRRETSQEPPMPSQSQALSRLDSRLDRTSTSLYRRRDRDHDDDDDPTLRAVSRAMTDFKDTRSSHKPRYSREYTSQEPMPDLQPSPALPTPTSTRRTTLTGNENNLLYRERDTTLGGTRRYGLTGQNSIASEKLPVAKTQFVSNRNSIGGSFPLGRSASLSRKRVTGE